MLENEMSVNQNEMSVNAPIEKAYDESQIQERF